MTQHTRVKNQLNSVPLTSSQVKSVLYQGLSDYLID